MKNWRMIVDIASCEDCNNCTLACKDEHVENEWPGYAIAQPRHGQRWIDVARKERGAVSAHRCRLSTDDLHALRRCALRQGVGRRNLPAQRTELS